MRSVLESAANIVGERRNGSVGVARQQPHSGVPMITLATAHPAKFPAAVAEASGIEPALPAWLADLYERPERVTVLANDQRQIEDFIAARSRA